jgi:hypothetical protein
MLALSFPFSTDACQAARASQFIKKYMRNLHEVKERLLNDPRHGGLSVEENTRRAKEDTAELMVRIRLQLTVLGKDYPNSPLSRFYRRGALP